MGSKTDKGIVREVLLFLSCLSCKSYVNTLLTMHTSQICISCLVRFKWLIFKVCQRQFFLKAALLQNGVFNYVSIYRTLIIYQQIASEPVVVAR